MQRSLDPVEIEPDAWCAWCGDTLPEEAERDPRQRFCSAKCRKAYSHDKLYRPKAPRTGTCETCGATFETFHPARRFCSILCGARSYRQRVERPSRAGPPPKPRACIECGKTFRGIRRSKKYCSETCGNRARNRRWLRRKGAFSG